MKSYKKLRLFTHLMPTVACLVLATLFPGLALAASSGTIAQSYQTNTGSITEGTLVSLTATKSGSVVPASNSSAGTLIGIAVSKPLVELSAGKPSSVQVAVSGTVDAFVSDANGPISSGDKITASPISGIGMKAVSASEIVGTAQTSLSSVKTVTKSFAEKSGKKISVKIGLVPITVAVSYYAATSSESLVSSILPPFLQSIANSLTGKQVSPLRVLIGACALILGFVAVTTMLYVAIRSQIISIGRNPLAESAIRKGLVDVIVAAIGVLIITIGVVYGVLFS